MQRPSDPNDREAFTFLSGAIIQGVEIVLCNPIASLTCVYGGVIVHILSKFPGFSRKLETVIINESNV